jgi:FG-GAP-like repeat/FG-GAP repeat
MPVIEGADMNMDRRGGVLGLWIVGMLLLGASCVEPKEFTPLPPSVPQLRLPRNDVYEGSVITGALRPTFVWEPSTFTTGGPLHYELQYSADPDLTDAVTIETSEPTFRPSDALPVSTVPPVGRRYYWHVRACLPAICSDYSPTWWVNLGRSNKDFNGDGYADVAVGAPADQNRGAVYVYLGGPNGLDTTHDGVMRESTEGDWFGGSISPADFNGDGFSDLLVGAYVSSASGQYGGRALLYFGGPGTSINVRADVIFSGILGEGRGKSVSSAGDLNGDGFSDVVLGAPNNNGGGSEAGRAYIYFGGIEGTLDLEDGILNGRMASEQFGQHVASAGDLDADGFSDLIVTSGHFDDAFRTPCIAQVFRGAPGNTFTNLPALTLKGNTDADCGILGANAGDIDRNGFADLLVGTYPSPGPPFASLHMGNVNILTISEAKISSISTGYRRINTLALAGDVNGDGLSDIVIGDEGSNSYARALVFLGSGTENYLVSTPAAALTSTIAGPSTFGTSLGSPGDINGDGFDDLVIGAYQDSTVYIFHGNAGGSIEPTADAILTSSQSGLYGLSVL